MSSPAVGFDTSQSFPNIGYVGAGYDLAALDPTAYGDSSAIRTSPLAPSLSSVAPDGMHLIPNGMNYRPGSFSADDITSEVVFSSTRLQNSFRVDVETEVGVENLASFGTSNYYQQVNSDMSTSQSVHYVENHVKSLYTLSMDLAWIAPNGERVRHFMNPSFENAVLNLGFDPNGFDYASLINNFGTHVAKDVTFGGNYFIDLTVSASSYEQSTNAETGFKVNASGIIEGVKLGGSVGFSTAQERAQSSGIQLQNIRVRDGGGNLTDQSYQEWLNNFQQNLVPVKIMFIPLSALLTPDYFNDPNIQTKQSLLRQAIESRRPSVDPGAGLGLYSVRPTRIIRTGGSGDLGGARWELSIRGIKRNGAPGSVYNYNQRLDFNDATRNKFLNGEYKLVGDYSSLVITGEVYDPDMHNHPDRWISDPTPPEQSFDLTQLQPGSSANFPVRFFENVNSFSTEIQFSITREP